jgi:ribosome-associated protein
MSYFRIPASELRVTFSRSSGAGGQNVNKTSTKATVHWAVGRSRVLTDEEKARVRAKLSSRINASDEVVVVSEEERSQPQNRALAVARLQALLARALIVPKKRRATRPTKASKLRQKELKIRRSRIKVSRRMIG